MAPSAPDAASELCWECQSHHSVAYCPNLSLTNEQWDSLREKFGHPAPGDPRYRRRGMTQPGPLPQYREPCGNCWTSRNHRSPNCPYQQLTVPEREILRVKVGVPLYAFWQDILKDNGVLKNSHRGKTDDMAVDEKCPNCWGSRAHGAEECPEQKLSTTEREKLRRKLRLPLLATWRDVLREEGLTAVDDRDALLSMMDDAEAGPRGGTTKTRSTPPDSLPETKPQTRQRSKTVGSRIPLPGSRIPLPPKSRTVLEPKKAVNPEDGVPRTGQQLQKRQAELKKPSKPESQEPSYGVQKHDGDKVEEAEDKGARLEDEFPHDVRELNRLITEMLGTLKSARGVASPPGRSTSLSIRNDTPKNLRTTKLSRKVSAP